MPDTGNAKDCLEFHPQLFRFLLIKRDLTPRGCPLNTGFTVFIRSERVIETYVQRRQCLKSTKSLSCCYYILQEKEENSDIIVLIRHVFMFLYYITLMCLNDKTVPSSKIACSACFRQAAYHKMFF